MSDQWPVGDVDELVDEQSADMRLVLPVDVASELAAGIGRVLESASVHAAPLSTQEDWVATFVAPELAARDATIADLRAQLEDAGLQVQQAGKALAESMAASVAVAGHHVWLKGVAYRRHCSAQRLREELAAALVEVERFRTLTEQRCPIGAHTGWFAPSDGRQHRCPWCQILELGGYVGHIEHVAVAQSATPMLCDGCGSVDKPVEATDDGRALVCAECQEQLAKQCLVHGPHPHANLACPDCPACRGEDVVDESTRVAELNELDRTAPTEDEIAAMEADHHAAEMAAEQEPLSAYDMDPDTEDDESDVDGAR